MDSSLWSEFPEDLLPSILAYLPLESLARFEQVCHNWKSLWQNGHFLRLRSEAEASSNSWFIFRGKQDHTLSSSFTVDCYNTHSNKWHELTFDHLPPFQQVCATSGSLLLCVGGIESICTRAETNNVDMMLGRYEPLSGYKFRNMMVCNPLKSNSWELIDLPSEQLAMGSDFIPHIGMVADTCTGNYKVIIGSPQKMKIYDSRQKIWKSFDSIWCHLHDYYTSCVEYRGQLLFLGRRSNGHEKIFMYNLEHMTSSSFDNHFSQNPGFMHRYLENCGGRLLMVSLTHVSTCEVLTWNKEEKLRHVLCGKLNFKLQVSEYLHMEDDLSDGVWHKLTSMSTLELERSMSVNSKEGARFLKRAGASSSTPSSSSKASLVPSSRNDLLCVTVGMQDEKLDWFNHEEERAIFLYSLSQNLWCFVGKRPEWSPERLIFSRSLQFQPSLHASLAL